MFRLTSEKQNPCSKLLALLPLMLTFVVTSFIATTAWAQSSGAHFQNGSVSAAIQSNGDLVVSWVEAGLGNLDVSYTVGGHADATYYCVTHSGSIPDASNKHTVSTNDTSTGTFKVKNGKVSGSLTLTAPAAPVSAPPTCGGGQTLKLQSITWSNVMLADTTNNVATDVTKGTFSITLYPAP
jgi:hypothetical protein